MKASVLSKQVGRQQAERDPARTARLELLEEWIAREAPECV